KAGLAPSADRTVPARASVDPRNDAAHARRRVRVRPVSRRGATRMNHDANLDVRARLAEAIGIQRYRLYPFKAMKEPEQAECNDPMRAYAALLKEARSVVKDGIRWSKGLSPEERRAVIVDWYQSLPANQQRLLLDELAKHTPLRAVP